MTSRADRVLARIRDTPEGFVRAYGDVSPGAPRFAGTVLAGCDDPDVPWQHAMALFDRLGGNPAITLIKQGDHRLSTPSDLVRFAIAINNGTLLKPETVTLLQSAQKLSGGQETGYGLGWDLETVDLAEVQLFTNFANGWANELSLGYNTINDVRNPPVRTPEISVAVGSTAITLGMELEAIAANGA